MIAQASNYSTTPVVNDTNPAAGLQHHPKKYKRVNIKHQTDSLRKKQTIQVSVLIMDENGITFQTNTVYVRRTCIYLIM